MEFLRELKASDWAIVFATLLGPVLAVQAQKWLERIRDRFNQKRYVYVTLMATRGPTQRLTPEHTRALNSIDLAFHGTRIWKWRFQSATERTVTQAWATYLDNLSTDVSQYSPEQLAVLFDRRTQFFFDLLIAMGRDVGFDFDRLHIEKSSYMPRAHGEQEEQQKELFASLREVFSGRKNLRMDVVSMPTNEEGAAAFKKMCEQVTKAVENGSVTVKPPELKTTTV